MKQGEPTDLSSDIMQNQNDASIPWENEASSPTAEHSGTYPPPQEPGSFDREDVTLSYASPAPLDTLYPQQDLSIPPNIPPEMSRSGSHLPPGNMSPSERQSSFGRIIPEPTHQIMGSPNSTLGVLSSGRNIQSVDSFSRNWYHHNPFNSINWLPDNWTPDFPMEDRNDMESSTHEHYSTHRDAIDVTQIQIATTNMPVARNPARSQEARSHTTSLPADIHNNPSPGSQSTHSAGQYYVDGEGARLPRVRKAPYRIADPVIPLSPSDSYLLQHTYAFPNSEDCQETMNISVKGEIPSAIYNEIFRIFNITCVTSTHYMPFQTAHFPSRRFLSYSIRLYRENFLSVLPFIHPATFNLSASHWLFILAVASIGNHYFESEDAGALVIAMHEFTRRAIQFIVRKFPYKDSEDEPVLSFGTD